MLDRRQGLPIEYKPTFSTPALERPEKASVDVARRIISDVMSEGYQVGDRLPAEPDMLRIYDASRETLREALRLLEVQGLISIRRGPGGGPRVSSVNAVYLARSASLFFHVSGASYREVFEAWLVLEPVIVGQVARRPDRQLVAERLAPFLELNEINDPAAIFDLSAKFHAVVGELSGNRVLVLLTQSINHILSELMLEAIDLERTGSMIKHDHHTLAQAIIYGHTRRAQEFAAQHIVHLRDEFESLTGGRIDELVDWR